MIKNPAIFYAKNIFLINTFNETYINAKKA